MSTKNWPTSAEVTAVIMSELNERPVMTLPTQTAEVQLPLPVVAWRKPGARKGFDYIEHETALNGLSSEIWQPLCKVSDAQAHAAQRTQELTGRVKVLEEALRGVVSVAKDAHSHWDAGSDNKVGKYLLALAGFNAGHDKRTDEVHAALNQTKDTK